MTQNSTSGVARGILVDAPDSGRTPSYSAIVTGNDVAIMDNVAGVGGLVVQARNTSTGCFNVASNEVTYPNGNPGVNGVRVRQTDTSVANLERGGSASNDPVVVLAANNPASTTEILGVVGVVNNGTCATPTLPALP